MFLCAQVTWSRVERLIHALKEDRRSPRQKYVAHFCLLANLFNKN